MKTLVFLSKTLYHVHGRISRCFFQEDLTMRLLSTRGLSAPVDAPEAVLRGIAPDGGLYIPDEIPAIPPQELWGADFCSLAQRILCAYLPGYTEDEIRLVRIKFISEMAN